MPKIAVISDSHWGSVHLKMFADIARRENYDEIVHCGDGLSDAKWLAKELDRPVRVVAGNCDPRWSCDRELRATYENVRMLAVHGDLYGVKIDLCRLSYYAEEANAQVVLFGHTHQAVCHQEEDGLWVVNPGSCGYYGGSAGLIEIVNNKITDCRIIRQNDLEEMV